MLPKTMTEAHLQEMFEQFGTLREVKCCPKHPFDVCVMTYIVPTFCVAFCAYQIHIIRSPEGLSKGCAFVKFMTREAATQAIHSLHDTIPEVPSNTHIDMAT